MKTKHFMLSSDGMLPSETHNLTQASQTNLLVLNDSRFDNNRLAF